MVGASNPGRGTIIGGILHPANMSYIVNSIVFRISPRGEEVNYRPYASTSFEVAKPRKITVI